MRLKQQKNHPSNHNFYWWQKPFPNGWFIIVLTTFNHITIVILYYSFNHYWSIIFLLYSHDIPISMIFPYSPRLQSRDPGSFKLGGLDLLYLGVYSYIPSTPPFSLVHSIHRSFGAAQQRAAQEVRGKLRQRGAGAANLAPGRSRGSEVLEELMCFFWGSMGI